MGLRQKWENVQLAHPWRPWASLLSGATMTGITLPSLCHCLFVFLHFCVFVSLSFALLPFVLLFLSFCLSAFLSFCLSSFLPFVICVLLSFGCFVSFSLSLSFWIGTPLGTLGLSLSGAAMTGITSANSFIVCWKEIRYRIWNPNLLKPRHSEQIYSKRTMIRRKKETCFFFSSTKSDWWYADPLTLPSARAQHKAPNKPEIFPLWMKVQNTIRVGGSTALWSSYSAYTVYIVNTVHTICTVYYLVTLLDDFSPLHWDLCIDHLYISPSRHQRNIVQLCTYCLYCSNCFILLKQ